MITGDLNLALFRVYKLEQEESSEPEDSGSTPEEVASTNVA